MTALLDRLGYFVLLRDKGASNRMMHLPMLSMDAIIIFRSVKPRIAKCVDADSVWVKLLLYCLQLRFSTDMGISETWG